jgi:hypothetical protein
MSLPDPASFNLIPGLIALASAYLLLRLHQSLALVLAGAAIAGAAASLL